MIIQDNKFNYEVFRAVLCQMKMNYELLPVLHFILKQAVLITFIK